MVQEAQVADWGDAHEMMLWLMKWIHTIWGRITTFAVGLVALLTLGDFFGKWGLYAFLVASGRSYLWPELNRSFNIPLYLLFVLLILLFVTSFISLKRRLRKQEYFIQIKDRFSNGSEPNEHTRRTRWHFKNYTKFYYIPLLSHGYGSVDFVDICGPYCATCNHILHLEGSRDNLGHTFSCINCNRKYEIPRELRGNYWNRLFHFFQEEFRQGRLREAQ